MNFINCTPHTINEAITGQQFRTSGTIARVDVASKIVDIIEDISIYENAYGSLVDLPEPIDNVLFIVSGLVLEAAKLLNRTDCVSPGELVRNSEGQPIGCKGFKR
jgi:hypothetical protein